MLKTTETTVSDYATTVSPLITTSQEKAYAIAKEAKKLQLSCDIILAIASFIPGVGPFAMAALIGMGTLMKLKRY